MKGWKLSLQDKDRECLLTSLLMGSNEALRQDKRCTENVKVRYEMMKSPRGNT